MDRTISRIRVGARSSGRLRARQRKGLHPAGGPPGRQHLLADLFGASFISSFTSKTNEFFNPGQAGDALPSLAGQLADILTLRGTDVGPVFLCTMKAVSRL